jgi:hypothetical protein
LLICCCGAMTKSKIARGIIIAGGRHRA